MNTQVLAEKIKSEAAWAFDRLKDSASSDTDLAYYQGRIDALSTALKIIYGEDKISA